MADVYYDFGNTAESRAFLERNPGIEDTFQTLLTLTNKCFGRGFQPISHADDLVFDLGQTCREDFMEIAFLAMHGFGNGASKLLRGMFERAVTAAYLIKHPEKAERFLKYGAIQEHRAMEAALRLVSVEEFDTEMGPENTVAEIKRRYRHFKPEFETMVHGKLRVAPSWDALDFASMVHHAGEPFRRLYLPAYYMPNLHVHPTLASIKYTKDPRLEADLSFKTALGLMITVIAHQNRFYKLDMIEELTAFAKSIGAEWFLPRDPKQRRKVR